VRLGVLGGSFNPVHSGHLHIAEQCRDLFGLTHVFFVVASSPPHKPPEDLIPFIHRYTMVSLAVSGRPHFVPSPVEADPPASPYSVETLAKLSRTLGASGTDLYFIAGGDSLLDVAAWRRSADLLTSYNFIFAMRPGFEISSVSSSLPPAAASRVVDCRGLEAPQVRRRIAAESAASQSRIFVVDVAAPDIAASHIRRLASQGLDFGRLVPPSVHEYIRKLHLYGER
jgi:nicotinate-nucleotide adenylyltransferase